MDPSCNIIHQTWKTTDLPHHWKDTPSEWKKFHPDWEYKLWTDEDNLTLIQTKFPHYLEMYQNFPYGIMRADFVRYAILYTHGGLYSDLDIVPLRPFDESTFKGTSSDVYLMKNNHISPSVSIGVLTNALMIAAKKESSFWLEIMKEIEHRYKHPHWLWIGKHRTVINTTGPAVLTKVFHSYHYPLTVLPTNVTLCNVCDVPGTTRGTNPQVMSIEGKSWNGWDTTILNFFYCNSMGILLLLLVLILFFIYRFFVYRNFWERNQREL